MVSHVKYLLDCYGHYPTTLYMIQMLCIQNQLVLPWAFLMAQTAESACSVGNQDSIPGSGRLPGEGIGNPLQHSCLETSMDRGDWQATVHGNAESDKTESLAFTFQCFSSCVPLTITSILRLFCPIRVTLAKLSTFSSA